MYISDVQLGYVFASMPFVLQDVIVGWITDVLA